MSEENPEAAVENVGQPAAVPEAAPVTLTVEEVAALQAQLEEVQRELALFRRAVASGQDAVTITELHRRLEEMAQEREQCKKRERVQTMEYALFQALLSASVEEQAAFAHVLCTYTELLGIRAAQEVVVPVSFILSRWARRES